MSNGVGVEFTGSVGGDFILTDAFGGKLRYTEQETRKVGRTLLASASDEDTIRFILTNGSGEVLKYTGQEARFIGAMLNSFFKEPLVAAE